MSYQAFILEIVEGLTEERIGNFSREQNTDDAYTFEEFLPELEDFLNDNYGDVLFGEPNYKHINFLREHPEEREDIYGGVCQDLEEFYKKEKHICEWISHHWRDYPPEGIECEEPAVFCKTYGLEYCAEHICESLGGDWCEDETCENCNEARRLLRIEVEEEEKEKNNGVHGWAVAT